MRTNRIIALTVAALLAMPAAVAAPKGGAGRKKPPPPPPATQTFTAPFAFAFASAACSPETPAAACDVERAADSSGALRSAVSLERTVPEAQGWIAQASATAGARYQLSEPVASVTATFDIQVNSTVIENAVLGLGGGDVRAYASAYHSACDACDMNSYETVAARYGPGTESTSGRTVTLTIEMTNPQGAVPAGTLTVTGMLQSWASLSYGAGRIASSADATLTRIVVTPNV